MKYTPGLMVGQLSGKAGSTVASRNRGGSYFRTRVIPKLVQNAATSYVRGSFTRAAQRWRNLTDTQRAAWNARGQAVTRKNSLGEVIHLSGINAYVDATRNADTVSVTFVDDPAPLESPTQLSFLEPVAAAGAAETTTVTAGANSATQQVGSTANMYVGASLFFATAGEFREVASITDGTHVVLTSPILSTTAENINWTGETVITMDFAPGPLSANDAIAIYATAPQSAGVTRPPKSAYRFVYANSPSQTSPVTLTDVYFSVFGTAPAGSKIFFKAKTIQIHSYIASNPVEMFAVVS